MPECLNLAIKLPKFDVVTVYKLFGLLNGLNHVLTMQINSFLNVAIRSEDIGAIALHHLALARRPQAL
jgi:hypothetical protein